MAVRGPCDDLTVSVLSSWGDFTVGRGRRGISVTPYNCM